MNLEGLNLKIAVFGCVFSSDFGENPPWKMQIFGDPDIPLFQRGRGDTSKAGDF